MSDQTFIKLENLTKSYGSVTALNDVSINIRRGELVSFIGPSGCGKTTLLRTIGGFHQQDSGSITLDGEVIDGLAPDKRATGMVFQSYALFPHMSVYKNVAYGLQAAGIRGKERRARVDEALAQVRLEGFGDRTPAELSGGQQQRVAIARCLVLRPKVLLLDEPLSNLDAHLRVIMRDEIRRIKDELNITVLFVTHDQEEALSISDRVLVLKEGVTQQIGEPEDIYDFPANEFVSNFVGQSNLLRGTLSKGDGAGGENGLLLEAEGSQFPIQSLRGHQDGETYEVKEPDGKEHLVLVRPERVRIDPDSTVQGELTHIVYNGSFTRYSVRIGTFDFIVDESNSARSRVHTIGDRLGIRFPATPYIINS